MQIFQISLFLFSKLYLTLLLDFTKDSIFHDNRTAYKEVLKERRNRAILLPAHN